MKSLRIAAVFAAALLLGAWAANAQGTPTADAPAEHDHTHDHDHDHAHDHDHGAAAAMAEGEAPAPPQWDEQTLHTASTLPIQDGGRIKPLSTYANFLLLRLNGRRSWTDDEGNGHDAIEWLLNTMLYPETAKHYKVFRIQDSALLDDIGVSHEGKNRRDVYSYADLSPGIPRLFSLAQEYSSIQQQDQTPYQRQVLNLASNVHEFERVYYYLDFARRDYAVNTSAGLQHIFEDRETVSYSEALAQAKLLQRLLSGLESGIPELGEGARQEEHTALARMLTEFLREGNKGMGLALIPPVSIDEERAEWYTPAKMIETAFQTDKPLGPELALLGELEQLAQARGDSIALKSQLAEFHSAATNAAQARGEYKKIPLEVSYYEGNYLFYAQWTFLLCFILAAFMWLKPGSKSLASRVYAWGTLGLLCIPTALLIYAIVLRCIIRERPPVSTLYETILFITASIVLTGIIIEVMNRRRIAISVAAFLGALGMFLANRYEVKEGVDTMPSLIAVLDTNFWLATHVTVVTLGYAAGLLAAAIAHIFILGKTFGIKKHDKVFYRDLTRMVYGVTAFCLCFATVGTVLGGIWANDSWGRFWGWDPKENGALMIVLVGLAMLHARMGGYLKQFGLNIAAVFLGIVVAFSWWGVNLLGVGLHSYGFTSGVMQVLFMFYAFECLIMVMGAFAWLREKGYIAKAEPATTTVSEPAAPPRDTLEAPGK